MLQNGFPREASVAVEIGGVRTNFRMPDVLSFGLGGGSLVRVDGETAIGPDSVGYELTSARSSSAATTLTTTDLAAPQGARASATARSSRARPGASSSGRWP